MAIKTQKDLPENARPLWLKALSAVEQRNYSYAVSLLQAVLKDCPEFLDGRKLLRKSQLAAGPAKKSLFGGFSTQALKGSQLLKKDPTAALEAAEKALEGDPRSAQGNHLLKDAALALGMPETAIFALQTLSEADPKDTKVLHELADLCFEQGDLEKASATYTKILEINPADLIAAKRAKDTAAATTMKTGGWDTAKDYRDLIKNKDEAAALEQKSRVVKSEEAIADQIAELRAEVEKNPQSVDNSRRIADLYEQSNDLDNATAWYQYVNGITNGTDAWIVRKIADLQLKQLENGIKEREEWLAVAGGAHEESARIQGELEALRAQRGTMMLEEARRRVDRNPTDLLFKFELAEQLFIVGEYADAIRELQKARQNPNIRLKAIALLGRCYEKRGMNDLAAKQFTEAAAEMLAMDATKKEILYQLGLLYEKMGDAAKALDCFKQIYEVDYGYEDVADRVERSYSQG
jgi:tetratricopeptide (TPR) repeat protein